MDMAGMEAAGMRESVEFNDTQRRPRVSTAPGEWKAVGAANPGPIVDEELHVPGSQRE